MAIKFFQKVLLPNKQLFDIDKLNNGDEVTVISYQGDNVVKTKSRTIAKAHSLFSSSPWLGYRVYAADKAIFASGNTGLLLENGESKNIENLNEQHTLYGVGKVDKIEYGKVLCGQKWFDFDNKVGEELFINVEGIWVSPFEGASDATIDSSKDTFIFPKNPVVRFIRKQLINMNEKKG